MTTQRVYYHCYRVINTLRLSEKIIIKNKHRHPSSTRDYGSIIEQSSFDENEIAYIKHLNTHFPRIAPPVLMRGIDGKQRK